MPDDLLDKHPVLRSKVLKDVRLAATTTRQEVSHGLGQGYIGATVLCVSPLNLVTVLSPRECLDPSKRLAIQLHIPVATTVTLMVFY